MAVSKHSFASTRYRLTSRQIYNYPGDEIPTRSAGRYTARNRNYETRFQPPFVAVLGKREYRRAGIEPVTSQRVVSRAKLQGHRYFIRDLKPS